MNPASDFHRLGLNIRHYRHTRQMKQYELAAKADCHPNQLSRIERGHAVPSVELLFRLAHALDCHVCELVESI